MASKNVKTFTDQNFEAEVLKSGEPVLVDFTATWCGPCKALAPVIDQLADELVGKVRIGKLDIDESPVAAGRYGVRNIPTVMLFRGGERVGQLVGLSTKAKLLSFIEG